MGHRRIQTLCNRKGNLLALKLYIHILMQTTTNVEFSFICFPVFQVIISTKNTV